MEHNAEKYSEAYIHSRRPVALAFYHDITDPRQVIVFEKKIKKWSRVKKQCLIEDNFDKLQDLFECRNATHHKYNPNKR